MIVKPPPPRPIEHWCAEGCGRWGAWGIGAHWWCGHHRPGADAAPDTVATRTTFATIKPQGNLF